jgi:hypothetical protein
VTEDAIIHVGKNNPADSLNLGYIEEFNDGAVKFSGILRSKDDKKHYVVEDVTPQPSGSTDVTALTRGDLVAKDIDTNNIDALFNVSGRGIIINDNSGTPKWSLTNNNLIDALELRDSDNDLIYDVDKATDQTTFYKTLNVYNTQVPYSRFNIGSSAMIHDRADSNAFGAGYTGRKARGNFTLLKYILRLMKIKQYQIRVEE